MHPTTVPYLLYNTEMEMEARSFLFHRLPFCIYYLRRKICISNICSTKIMTALHWNDYFYLGDLQMSVGKYNTPYLRQPFGLLMIPLLVCLQG